MPFKKGAELMLSNGLDVQHTLKKNPGNILIFQLLPVTSLVFTSLLSVMVVGGTP